MPRVVLTYREARGKTPDVCMCCGAPATCRVEHTIRLYNGTGGVSMGVLGAVRAIYIASQMLASPPLTMRAPFCSAHQWHWKLRTYAAIGFVGMIPVVLVMAGILIAIFGADSMLAPSFAFLTMLVLAVVLLVLGFTVIRMEYHDEDKRTIALACVHRDFITALQEYRAQQVRDSAEEALVAELAEPEVPPTAIGVSPTSRRPAPARRPRYEEDEPRPRRRPRDIQKQNGLQIALIVGIPFALVFFMSLAILFVTTMSGKSRQQANAGNAAPDIPFFIGQGDPGQPPAGVPDAPAGLKVVAAPATAPLPEVLKNRESIDLIPLIDLSKDVVHGRWKVVDGVLHCLEPHFVPRVQVPYLPPEEYDFVVTFLQPGLRNGVSLVMPNPRGGSFYWSLANDGGAGFGFGTNPARPGRIPDLVKINTIYTTVVQVRKTGVRAFLDGRELMHLETDFRDLVGNDWFRLHDNRFLGLAVDDPTVIYYARLIEVGGHGKKAR